MTRTYHCCTLVLVAISTRSSLAAGPGHWESPTTVSAAVPSAGSRERSRAQNAEPTARVWARGPYRSIQVNVDYRGRNIVGDAANEPSIAVDPTDPTRMVIGWRQFDTTRSGLRQAGWAYSHDAGLTWTFPGVIEPGVFGSDPVLDSDADGNFYYHSIRCPHEGCGNLFTSTDGGRTWSDPVPTTMGDKPWMAIDRTNGLGRGNIYCAYVDGFSRSIDGGATFEELPFDAAWAGTMSVAPNGVLHSAGSNGTYYSIVNLDDPAAEPSFGEQGTIPRCPAGASTPAAPGGDAPAGPSWPNGNGLLGQAWVATDHSEGPTCGNVYILIGASCVDGDPRDIMFTRSVDGGATWSEPIRVNDDPPGNWQWFETMSVAPNGRIDVVWNDTRTSGEANLSELHYAYSTDGGLTFSRNVAVSPMFDSWLPWSNGTKLGDYYDMVSDDLGANVAYAATFTDEHDVYFLRIGPWDCNTNGIDDLLDIQNGVSADCNGNDVPDECERDCNHNGTPDTCDIADGSGSDDDEDGLLDECEVRLHVDATARGAGTGMTWNDAYADLQDALAYAAGAGGTVREIWVARGEYKPDAGTGDPHAKFSLPGGVALYGGFAGGETELSQRDPTLNLTVLSGDLLGDDTTDGENIEDNAFRVVEVGVLGVDTTIDGFTITGGFARRLTSSGRGYGSTPDGGSALFGMGRGLSVANCAFVRNRSRAGAGAVNCHSPTARFVNCLFSDNSVAPDQWGDWGGALSAYEANATVEGCTFYRNHSGGSGGAIANTGGHISISDSIFVGNTAAEWSGAILLIDGSATIVNSMFAGNAADQGGAVGQESSVLAVADTTFAANSAEYGGALRLYNADLTLLNCILWGNHATQGEGESAEIFASSGSPISIGYSCVRGLTGEYGGVGNTGSDPLFVDPAGADGIPGTLDDDLRLSPNSPCINRGDPSVVPTIASDDLDGNPRVRGCRVDMGAYESDRTQLSGDFDDTGTFDLADVAALQSCMDVIDSNPAWSHACLCVFDMDDSGNVDLADFAKWLALLNGPR